MSTVDSSSERTSPRGIAAMGLFLIFATLMASLACVTLVWPGTILDRAWALNPRAYKGLAPLGRVVGVPFLLFGVTLAITSAGWSKRRRWAWQIAIAVIATQAIGDFVNMCLGHWLEGGFGVTVAGALLVYLLSGPVRTEFGRPAKSDSVA